MPALSAAPERTLGIEVQHQIEEFMRVSRAYLEQPWQN
jgi:hypothetical protein